MKYVPEGFDPSGCNWWNVCLATTIYELNMLDYAMELNMWYEKKKRQENNK